MEKVRPADDSGAAHRGSSVWPGGAAGGVSSCLKDRGRPCRVGPSVPRAQRGARPAFGSEFGPPGGSPDFRCEEGVTRFGGPARWCPSGPDGATGMLVHPKCRVRPSDESPSVRMQGRPTIAGGSPSCLEGQRECAFSPVTIWSSQWNPVGSDAREAAPGSSALPIRPDRMQRGDCPSRPEAPTRMLTRPQQRLRRRGGPPRARKPLPFLPDRSAPERALGCGVAVDGGCAAVGGAGSVAVPRSGAGRWGAGRSGERLRLGCPG